MNVSGIGATRGTTGVSPATWSGASRPSGGSGAVGRMQSVIGAVSQLLNVQPSDLVRQLGSGKSLSSIASAAGVSGQSLMATITKAVSASVPQGSQPLSGELLTKVSTRIAESTKVPAGFSVRQQG